MEDEAGVVELVDTQDLKSCGLLAVRVQVPPLVQKPHRNVGFLFLQPFGCVLTGASASKFRLCLPAGRYGTFKALFLSTFFIRGFCEELYCDPVEK